MLYVLAQTTTTDLTRDSTRMVVDSQASSTAGTIVFLVVVAIIMGGALVLYLRHRPRPTKEGT